MFMATLLFTSYYLYEHRKAGRHSTLARNGAGNMEMKRASEAPTESTTGDGAVNVNSTQTAAVPPV
jgi:hypothetical protein